MIHPNWYYSRYDKILAYGRNYDDEVDKINSICCLKDKDVQEIGSGTGEHAIRLLHKEVGCLELLDFDRKAVAILKDKFRSFANVNVIEEDGFTSLCQSHFDTVICMYSIILLSLNTLEELKQRITVLLRRLNEGGTFFFEVVDYDVCKKVHKEGDETVLYSDGSDVVKVRSEYSSNKTHFLYSGRLEGKRVMYDVGLLRLSKKELVDLLTSIELRACGCISLDASERRLLAFAQI